MRGIEYLSADSEPIGDAARPVRHTVLSGHNSAGLEEHKRGAQRPGVGLRLARERRSNDGHTRVPVRHGWYTNATVRAGPVIPKRSRVTGKPGADRLVPSSLPEPVFAPDLETLYDPASGLTLNNSGSTWVPSNNARLYDGTNDYTDLVAATDGLPLRIEAGVPWSYSIWVKLLGAQNNNAVDNYVFATQGTTGQSIQLLLFDNGANRQLYLYWAATTSALIARTATGAPAYTVGEWTHIVVTCDGTGNYSGVSFYVDGQSVAVNAPQSANAVGVLRDSFTHLAISGLGAGDTTYVVDGYLRKPMLFPGVLSATQAQTLYEHQRREALMDHSDDFSSGSDVSTNGWILEDSSPSSSPGSTITGGEWDFTISAGASGGSLWYDTNDGGWRYKVVTGAVDCRMRARIRNTADTGLPLTNNFRIAGLAAHDPDRTTMEYVHVGAGSGNLSTSQLEWKTTDNSDSAYAYTPVHADRSLDLDFRIVRRATDLQMFDLYYRGRSTPDPVFAPRMDNLYDDPSALQGVNVGTEYDKDDRSRTGDDASTWNAWTTVGTYTGLPISLSAWVRIPSGGTPATTSYVWYLESTVVGFGCAFYVGTNGAIVFTADYATTDLLRSTAAGAYPSDGEWHHVCVTWDGGATATGVTIYLDGTEVSYSTTTNGVGAQNPIDQNWYVGIGVPGSWAEPKAYDEVLTAWQVSELYQRESLPGVFEESPPLHSPHGWVLLETIDRTDINQPDRVANFGSAAVSLPDTLRWGPVVYASVATHDIRMFVSEVLFLETDD